DPDGSPLRAKAWELALQAKVLEKGCERHPEWRVVWYEDALAAPHEVLSKLFADSGLRWGDATERSFAEKLAESEAGRRRSSTGTEKRREGFAPDQFSDVRDVFASVDRDRLAYAPAGLLPPGAQSCKMLK